MELYNILLGALFFAITANTFVYFLFQPSDLLDWWPEVVQSATKNERLHKILFQCEKCMAGQIALWSYIGISLIEWEYHFLAHFSTVILSIFISGIIGITIQKLQNG